MLDNYPLFYKNNKLKYEGVFANDIFDKDGKYIFVNGDFYIGTFYNGLKYGKGKLYYKNRDLKF